MCDSPGAVGWEGGPERREMGELMTTQEVADYLRLKERKIYELVRQKRIPCTSVTGKWLFPKAEIDQWMGSASAGRAGPLPPADLPVFAGRQHPFLDWIVAESGRRPPLLADRKAVTRVQVWQDGMLQVMSAYLKNKN